MSAFLAGGSDLLDRKRHGLFEGSWTDLSHLDASIDATNGLRIGAMAPIADLARVESHRGLAEAAGHLATPQIRRQGTVAGNLVQSSRCRYFRHPHLHCTHKGDPECGAREGHDANAVLFDPGERGCPHPHPSTLGMALMAYDAEVEVNGARRPVADLYDANDRTRTHRLADDEVIEAIHVPAVGDERSCYVRVSARAKAEWAIVECCVRFRVEDGLIAAAQVAVGAVAPVPMRLPKVEEALVGQRLDEAAFARAASLATEGANPLAQSRYKLAILVAAVKQALLEA